MTGSRNRPCSWCLVPVLITCESIECVGPIRSSRDSDQRCAGVFEPMNRLSEYGLLCALQAPASPGAQSPGLRAVSRPRPAWLLAKHPARFTELTVFSQALERLVVRWMYCSLKVAPVLPGRVSRDRSHRASVQSTTPRYAAKRRPNLGVNGKNGRSGILSHVLSD